MDFFLQSMAGPTRRPPPSNQGGDYRPPPGGGRPQNATQGNQGYQSGGYNGPSRGPQNIRPQPPPLQPPAPPPNQMRYPPPPPQRMPRQQQYQQSQRFDQNESNPRRGRPHNQREYRDSESQGRQYQDYGGQRGRQQQHQEQNQNRQEHYQDRQPRDQSMTGYNRGGRQQFNPRRQNQYNSVQDNDRNSRFNQRQDRRNQDNRNQQRQGFRNDERQPQRYNQGQSPGRFINQEGRRNYQTEQPQYGGRGRGRGSRGRQRGRDRDRGRGRGRGRQYQEKPVQKAESEEQQSNSMEMESNEEVSQSENVEEESQYEEGSSSGQGDQQQMQQSSAEEEESHVQRGDQSESGGPEPSSESGSGSVDMQRIDTMVSKQQFNERLQTFRMNNKGGSVRLDTGRSFAIFEINKRNFEPDLALTLKRFRRSTNRGQNQEDQDETADCPRSRRGLHMTIKHILKEIIDADGIRPKDLAFPLPPGESKIEFLHIYDFLWNRMREMIKDVARLKMKDRGTVEVVTMCEQMLRFFIIAIREGRQPHTCKLQFDRKMCLESITKILTQLIEIYEMAHYKHDGQAESSAYFSPNEPQIMGYAILISNDLQKTLNQKLRVRVNGDGLDHPLLNSPQVQTALTIKKAVKNRDFESFYKILQSTGTDYVRACLLIHVLPSIRRETLRVLQKAHMKKMPVSSLKRALGFSANLSRQFYELLNNLDIKVETDGNQEWALFGNMNEALQDFPESYCFDFGYNKKDRSNYPHCQSKAVMIDQKIISREELIKRSWHKGNYLNQCTQYYQDQEVQSVEEFRPPELPKRQQIPKQVQVEKHEEKKDATKLNFLLQKKKQFNRNKFLKTLQGLVETLVKKSDVHSQHQRKKAAAMITQMLTLFQSSILQNALHTLRDYSHTHKTVRDTLNTLNRFATRKKAFVDNFYTGTFQNKNYNTGTSYRRLSQLVEPRAQIPQDIMSQLVHLAQPTGGFKKLNVLIIFVSSSQLPLSVTHIKFLKTLYSYLSEQSMPSSRAEYQVEQLCNLNTSKPYLDLIKYKRYKRGDLDFKVRFYHYRVQQAEEPMLCGFDTIITLDLHDNSKLFTKIINDMTECRRQIMKEVLGKCPPLKTNVSSLLVTSMDKLKQKIAQGKLKENTKSGFHILENEAVRLSLPLKHNLVQALATQIDDPHTKDTEFEVVSVNHILNQIEQNLQFAESVDQSTSSLEFFVKYFNQNLNYLHKSFCKVIQNYESYDWSAVLLEANYLKKPKEKSSIIVPGDNEVVYPDQKLNMNTLLAKKLSFTNEVLSMLNNMDFFNRFQTIRKDRPYSSNTQILAAAFEQYLQQFQKEQRPYSLQVICEYVIENNCTLAYRDNTIEGDAKALIGFLFAQLKRLLHYLTIILPKGFKFKLKKKQFTKTLTQEKRKTSEVSVPFKPIQTPTINVNYKYADLLSSLVAQMSQEDREDYEKLRKAGRKAVKT